MNELESLASELRQLIGNATGPLTKTRRSLLGFSSNPFANLAYTLNLRAVELVEVISENKPVNKVRAIIEDLKGQIMMSQTTDLLSPEVARDALGILEDINDKV
jgi:hypothetical protein